MRVLLASAAAVLCAAAVVAQDAPKDPPPTGNSRTSVRPGSRAGEYNVITEGCLQETRLMGPNPGEHLKDPAAEILGVTDWTLDGPRELMQMIRDLDRHWVEVTGIAVLPLQLEPRDDYVDSQRLPDGTRITIGVRDPITRTQPRDRSERRAQPRPERPGVVRLRVQSVRVIAERCTVLR